MGETQKNCDLPKWSTSLLKYNHQLKSKKHTEGGESVMGDYQQKHSK